MFVINNEGAKMVTAKYLEVWNLDVFFEGRSKLPVLPRFLKALSINVQHVVAQVQALMIEESRAVTARWLEIRHASRMLSSLRAQNTKDTTVFWGKGYVALCERC